MSSLVPLLFKVFSAPLLSNSSVPSYVFSYSYLHSRWALRANHFQSVWFERKHTFLFGMNLAHHDLGETFKQGKKGYLGKYLKYSNVSLVSGDPVNFIVARTSHGPTAWVARQVLVTDSGAAASTRGAPTSPHLAVGGPIGAY